MAGIQTPALGTISTTAPALQNVNLTQVGGSSFSLGQQLAGASIPVVLTAAQITTLTPFSTVTVNQGTNPWTVSGSVTATQATGTNLHTVIDNASFPVTQSTSPWVVSGTVTSTEPAPTVMFSGQATIAVTNTAVPLASSQLISGVIIQALSTNADNVYVGPSTVTTATGFELQPGQATAVAIDNINKAYVNGVSGNSVCFIAS